VSLRATVAVALAIVAAAEVSAASRARPRIDRLEVSQTDGRVNVSYRVADALTDEAVERVRSGIRLRFRHRVEILSRRAVPLWPSKTLARARIETEVAYDALTRTYALVRTVDVRSDGRTSPPITETRTTDSIDEVRSWMTDVDGVPSLAPLDGGSRMRVRVETVLGRRYALYVFPTRHTVAAEHRLEP
jgi:hypothetical protein